MITFNLGQLVEYDGLLAVVVGTPQAGSAPNDHLALWYGDPRGVRISDGGSGGQHPVVWIVPAEYCSMAASFIAQH